MSEHQNAPQNPVTQAAALAKAPIGSPEDVQRLLGAIEQIMDALDNVLIEETALLRNGEIKEALDLVEAKNQLSIQYMLCCRSPLPPTLRSSSNWPRRMQNYWHAAMKCSSPPCKPTWP